METTLCTTELEQFRTTLYQQLGQRADTLMELLDAICSDPTASSVVEYSLNSCFRRSYSTIFKALNEMKLDPMLLPNLLSPYLPPKRLWPFRLLGVDVTPQPRLYAHTLADRGMVYQPEVIKGNKPVTIGHQYSTLTLLPEPTAGLSNSWVVPLLTRRVHTNEDKELVGAKQVTALMNHPKLPFGNELCVVAADTSYSKAAYLHTQRQHHHLVTIARVRSNRTFYQRPAATADQRRSKGHPRWYGEPFSLSKPETWTPPDECGSFLETSRRGKRYLMEVMAWHDLLMPGKREPSRLAMHLCPFTLLRVVRYDQHTQLACKRPLWLLIMGSRRREVSLRHSIDAYRQRFNLEHFFRFGKQKLLLTQFQTPELKREENWWQLVHLAYAQLWMARHVTVFLPRPWERTLPAMKRGLVSPSLVRRDFGRVVRQLGTPAKAPKPRGISSGRQVGTRLPPRPRHKVVVKGPPKVNSP